MSAPVPLLTREMCETLLEVCRRHFGHSERAPVQQALRAIASGAAVCVPATPVAWRWRWDEQDPWQVGLSVPEHADNYRQEPLYAAPPPPGAGEG